MAKLGISTGSSPNDGSGDSLLDGAIKVNSNFSEIYTAIGDGSTLAVPVTSVAAGTGINVSGSTGSVTISATSGTGSTANISADSLVVTGVVTATTFSGNLPTTDLTGTITNAQLAGSIADGKLSSTFLKNVVEDTTPQLGGTLDINGKSITGTGNINLTGIVTVTKFVGAGVTIDSSGISAVGVVTATSFSGSGTNLTGLTGASAATYGDASNVAQIVVDSNGRITGISEVTISGGGGSGITTANIKADTLQVSGVSTFVGIATFGTVGIGTTNVGTANLAIVRAGSAAFSIGQNVDGTGQNHLGIYYGTALGTPPGADIFTSNGNMSFWVDGAGGGAGNSELEFGNAFGAGGGGATWISMSSSGLSVAGIVTARTGAAVTYYGDASYITAGKWVLGANGSTDYTFTGPGFTGATNDPILYLARGRVYEFVNTMNAHPFQIRVSNAGAAYNTGVTNNGTQNGTVRFEIPMDAPNTLYYQCTSHAGMGNTISVYPNTI